MRYETTANQMRYLLVKIRSILYSHPKVDPEPARVRFAEFGDASLNIEIFAYVFAVDFNEFSEVREDLLLRMMEVVEKSGSGFAFPSQTIYLAKDKGLSEENTKQAEEKVGRWKEKGELSIPKFNKEQIDSLRGSIAYPPNDSAKMTREGK
jgi:MscS family membrane protein